MDREILKYLYSFYKNGDFLSYHSLNPIFDKLKVKNGGDLKYFNERLKTITYYLRDSFFIDIEDNNATQFWTVKKEKDSFYDYSGFDNPISARILEPQGVEYIEKIIEWEHQIDVSESVKNTNWRMVMLTFALVAVSLFGLIREILKDKQQQETEQLLKSQLQSTSKTLQSLQESDSLFEIQVKDSLNISNGRPTK